MDDGLVNALTAIELRETALLAWGAVGARWTEAEILTELEKHGSGPRLLRQLLDAGLVVQEPGGGYRSRFAETVRLLATLRQAFRGQRVTEGRPLVLDYRLLHRPRRRPRRNVPAVDVRQDLRPHLGRAGAAVAETLLPEAVSGFQQRSAREILQALRAGDSKGVVITAGTGSGKTLAFYLPLLAWLADRSSGGGNRGTLALALYPRNELLKDQLRALLENVRHLRSAGQGRGLGVATWFGPTPSTARMVRDGRSEWPSRREGFVCPYLRCLECDADLVWRRVDLEASRERLTCLSCGFRLNDGVLRLTRESAVANPADVMLTTTESVNRQLAAPGNLAAFGVQPATLRAVLLDEVHTYEGTTGAQNAILLRRLRHALGRKPVWVGLSATLRNADEFFARLVGLRPGSVVEVSPHLEELEETGAEYLIALRNDPYAETGTLSTSIQACMALARCLDVLDGDPIDPPPSSDGVFGNRLFAFTDKLDSTNRLFWDVLDAEGWSWPGKPKTSARPLTLAHSRGRNQPRLTPDRQEPHDVRDLDGQHWWLPEHLGHGVDADRQLQVGRTSSQDRGVDGNAQVVIATATLEVGFDDDRVGAVLQHKAPHDAAQFLQRKGRAGRNLAMRPWTAVVLSDWGRDRAAWDSYDALFDPDLPPRNLPLENVYVMRIQAVYALLDWLAAEQRYTKWNSTWSDMAGPASALEPTNDHWRVKTEQRQHGVAELLGRLLRPGPERDRLREYLRRALGLGTDDIATSVVDTLLWEAPRPLLLAVVPTARRRLQGQWDGEQPAESDSGLRTRTPLREFVPGNLFDDLLVPDVELQVPGLPGQETIEHLPALRTLNEFCPGNVTRHFGVWASTKRHWIQLPPPLAGEQVRRVDVATTFEAVQPVVIDIDGEPVHIHAPTRAALESVPPDLRDASKVRPDWEVHISALGVGAPVRLSSGANRLLAAITSNLHVQGGGVQLVRYARTARGVIWRQQAEPVQLEFGHDENGTWIPGAVGVDTHCDALECFVRMPDQVQDPDPQERTVRLRHRLEVEAELPDDMSAFDRRTLGDIVLLAAVTEGFDVATDDRLAAELGAAATVLGLGQKQAWRLWLAAPAVLGAVRSALEEITATKRSATWTSWWRRRYTLSVAQAVLAAVSALCPGVDPDDVLLDLDQRDNTRFFLSEPSPGGTGQIDAFHRALAYDPAAFTRVLEEALRPSPVETMDEELTHLLRNDAPAMRAALDGLRRAWEEGHEAAGRAVGQVDDIARANGLLLSGPARTALSTRLAGPGAHQSLQRAVRSWLDLRDEVTQRTGLGVDARTIGGLLAYDTTLDPVLHLSANTTPERRARAISNVLWPWGEAVGADSFNPYAPPLPASLRTVRAHVTLGPEIVEMTEWNDAFRDTLHTALYEHGEILVRAGQADRAALRTLLLDLQVNPVEVGPLLCHPIVVGIQESPQYVEARLALREAP
ncbi:protein DpdJ [Pseudonocardia adelaidensis]|uniref:DEAD/DEAH box helicase n=1 Tax=Pseudonocardia adelaidensis TaxID=648754 RepID=A0ABP9NTR2_9PSEU